jgi:hypothetical protein
MHARHHNQPTLPQSQPKPTAVVAGDKGYKPPVVSAEEIRQCAYRKWEHAGKPAGDGLQFWLEAEQELARKN